MGITAMKCYEYWVVCDKCGRDEIYHTNDQDNGVLVHSIPSAIRAARFHESKGKLYCSFCYEALVYERTHKT